MTKMTMMRFLKLLPLLLTCSTAFVVAPSRVSRGSQLFSSNAAIGKLKDESVQQGFRSVRLTSGSYQYGSSKGSSIKDDKYTRYCTVYSYMLLTTRYVYYRPTYRTPRLAR
jgi:hypothetical protein